MLKTFYRVDRVVCGKVIRGAVYQSKSEALKEARRIGGKVVKLLRG